MTHKATSPRNKLLLYRKRLGLSQKHVARLLGHRDTSMISRYERGTSMPTTIGALQLEIIYRAPVAFLFDDLYQELRKEMRALEDRMGGRGQQELFRTSE